MKQNIVIIIFALWIVVCLTKWCNYDKHLEDMNQKIDYIIEETITMEKVNFDMPDVEGNKDE